MLSSRISADDEEEVLAELAALQAETACLIIDVNSPQLNSIFAGWYQAPLCPYRAPARADAGRGGARGGAREGRAAARAEAGNVGVRCRRFACSTLLDLVVICSLSLDPSLGIVEPIGIAEGGGNLQKP